VLTKAAIDAAELSAIMARRRRPERVSRDALPTPARAHEAHQGYPPLAVLTAEVIEARGGFVLPPELWTQLASGITPFIMSSGLHYVLVGGVACRIHVGILT